MILALRWTLRLFLALVVLAVLAGTLVYYLTTRALPDYSARTEVRGISAPFEIIRDTANVPHIMGTTAEDSFFGLGYVHAQDRLWQMMMLRRAAQGRLSELFGTRTLTIDEVMRRFDLYRLAARSVTAQDAATQRALTAYAAGVNAWIEAVNENALGRGAPEFFLFPPEIAPWQPADSLAVQKLMALRLTAHLDHEVLRARVALAVPPERLRDILPDVPGPGAAALPQLGWLAPGPADPRRAEVDFRDDPLSPIHRRPFAGASNAWAAAPDRSATGGTLLANDPHLALSAPSIWYLARVELPEGGVIGGTIPGLPLIITGRNATLGWGLTTASLDDIDLYIERLDPENPNRYERPGGAFAPMRREASVIRVKDAPPVTITLRWTDRGPVMPVDLFDLDLVTPRGYAVSVAWTGSSDQDRSVSAANALMRAGTIPEAIDAVAPYVAPAQNLVLADERDIALQVIGAQPHRNPDHDTYGRLPAPGWKAENQWLGLFPYETNPRFVSPEGGIVGNTNNKTVDRPFPEHVSFDWGDTDRIQRWTRLMQERRIHSRESFIDTQLDTVSPAARTLLPLIGKELWYTGEAAPEDTPEGRRRTALDLLANWTGEMNEHLPEPLIYAAWTRALQKRLITDELGGPLAGEFDHADTLFIERVFRDVDGAAAWCDVLRTAAAETCADMARLALDDALQWITETYGGRLESLHWGDAHVAMSNHEVLGSVPLLGWIVNIHQATSGGDDTLMRGRTSGRDPHPFRNVHAAAYRGVYDMADPDSSVFIISTGQSGHPLSRFYDNLGELWRRGEYIPMSLDVGLARGAATGVTVLEPEG
ncbi:MAG: penicillin acylase family protein [Qingshengfaniella sp.]